MKYPRIYRIPIPNHRTRGKHYLTEDQVAELLDGDVVVQEKIDGKLTATKVTGGIIFGEYMKWKHNIHYTRVPISSELWFVGFDAWNGRIWFDDQWVADTLELFSIPMVPILYRGKIDYVEQLLSYLGTPSAYGDTPIEGIVVKRYVDDTFLAGKIVDPQFEDDIDGSEHWTRKPRIMNRIDTCGYIE